MEINLRIIYTRKKTVDCFPKVIGNAEYPLEINIFRPAGFENYDLYFAISDGSKAETVNIGTENYYSILSAPTTKDNFAIQAFFITLPADRRKIYGGMLSVWSGDVPDEAFQEIADLGSLLEEYAWIGYPETNSAGDTIIRNIKGEPLVNLGSSSPSQGSQEQVQQTISSVFDENEDGQQSVGGIDLSKRLPTYHITHSSSNGVLGVVVNTSTMLNNGIFLIIVKPASASRIGTFTFNGDTYKANYEGTALICQKQGSTILHRELPRRIASKITGVSPVGTASISEYLSMPIPTTVTAPIGTRYTFAITQADIQQIADAINNPARGATCYLRFTSIAGDWVLNASKISAAGQARIDIDVRQLRNDGTFLNYMIYSGSYDGSGIINSPEVVQIKDITFSNCYQALVMDGCNIDATQARELSIFQHIYREIYEERIFDLKDLYDSLSGDLVAVSARAIHLESASASSLRTTDALIADVGYYQSERDAQAASVANPTRLCFYPEA